MSDTTEEPSFDASIHILGQPSQKKEHEGAVEALRLRLEESAPGYDAKYCSDHQLMLFLHARKYNIDEAFNMLSDTLDWRKLHSSSLHGTEEGWVDFIDNETCTGKIYKAGNDQWGRPLLVFDNQVQNTKSAEAHMKLLSWYLEHTISQMTDKVDKYTIFMHMEGFSIFNAPSLSESRETVQILCDCFPERLGHIIAYQAPGYFSWLLGALKCFIDERTMSKLVFINGDVSDGSSNDATLRQIIGSNWKELVGVNCGVISANSSPGYRHSDYWPVIKSKIAQKDET